MGAVFSHWGLLDDSDAEGSYEITRKRAVAPDIGMVLTEAGEVLINRSCKTEACCVAIVIGRSATGLSRPQSERLQRAVDLALAVANGNREAVELQPMSHHWRFSRGDYMTIEEWQELRTPAETAAMQQNNLEDRA